MALKGSDWERISMPGKWQDFIIEFLEQLKIYFFAVIYLGLFRILLIFIFRSKITVGVDIGDFLQAFGHGFRFDSTVAAWFMLIPLLANVILSPFNRTAISTHLRIGFSILMLFILTLAFVLTIPYFKEYDSQYNYFVFELLFDDRSAILRTVIREYNLFGNLALFIVLWLLAIYVLHLWQKTPHDSVLRLLTYSRNRYSKIAISVLIAILTLGALRGSFRSRPVMRKWADITTDAFLNKTVMNPLKHLQYAYMDFRSINSKTGGIRSLLGNMPIREAAEQYFPADLTDKQKGDLSNYLLQTAGGATIELPDHIFIVVMESYDSWPLMPKYASLDVANRVKGFGNLGIFFDHFLPAADNTMGSFSAIISGIPYTGVNISRLGARTPPFITSTPEIFKRLGYTTRFYYGGFLSWQNIGNFSKAQGFDEIIAAPSIKQETIQGVWGVDDTQLFEYVRTNTSNDERTFNVILTTTYHPPYDIDVKSHGFVMDEIPANLSDSMDVSIPVNQLGHFWYCDRAIGEFINAVESKLPSSIFALTGDHYGRKFLNSSPTIYEHTAVPFILYSNKFIAAEGGRNSTPGTHIDVVPTIVEMIAPTGFEYYSFGKSLLANQLEPDSMRFGIGYKTIVSDNFIANFKHDQHPAALPDVPFGDTGNCYTRLLKKHDQLLGLGWWLIFNGVDLYARD